MSREPPPGADDRTVIRTAPALEAPLQRVAAPIEPTVIAGALPGSGGWSEPTVIAGALPLRQASPAAVLDEMFATSPGEVASANPLMALAEPVLLPLARLLAKPAPEFSEAALHARFVAALGAFSRASASIDVAPEDIHLARDALAATVEDVVGHLRGIDPAAWRKQGGVTTDGMHKPRNFFEGLNRVLAESRQRKDIVELLHACLALGYEGQYRGRPNVAAELDAIRADVHALLRHIEPLPHDPHFGATSAAGRSARRLQLVPIALLGMAAVLAVAFGTMRYVLMKESGALEAELLALSPSGPVTIAEAQAPAAPPPAVAAPPPPDGALLERIEKSLADEIGAGAVTVTEAGPEFAIEINNALLFATGSATLLDRFGPLAAKLGELLDRSGGPIRIVGYTDNVKPRRSSPFRSNEALSAARAEALAKALAQHLKDASRLRVEGKGEADPIADNGTAEGRARNRRVVIFLPKEAVP